VKTFGLLLIVLLLYSCGKPASTRANKVTPVVSNPPASNGAATDEPIVGDVDKKKARKAKRHVPRQSDPVVTKKKLPKNINISGKRIWGFEVNETATLLKCYDKQVFISKIKLYSTNDGDTSRNLKNANDDLSFGYIPFDFFGIALSRWPQIDNLRGFKASKREIKKYCNGKSYIYIEDYKKNLSKGRHHIVARIVFYDNTVFFDYYNFVVK
jgi:hypothetical protein